MHDLTPEEERWIAALKRLGKRRPPRLGLWGGTGNLNVCVLAEDGGFMHDIDGTETVVFSESVAIPAGGGDPENVALADVVTHEED